MTKKILDTNYNLLKVSLFIYSEVGTFAAFTLNPDHLILTSTVGTFNLRIFNKLYHYLSLPSFLLFPMINAPFNPWLGTITMQVIKNQKIDFQPSNFLGSSG